MAKATSDELTTTIMARAVSPALSDISELTVLSRSPSPLPEYEAFTSRPQRIIIGNANTVSRLARNEGGRFMSRQATRFQNPLGNRPILKSRTLHESPTRSTRNSKNELISSLRQFNGPVPWIIGEGGFGTLALLPKEIRQYIYGYAFRVDRAVQVRECCGPDATKRERDACQKHGIGTKQGADRFNLFHLSKAIKEEASWVVFNQGSLRLPVSNAIAPYLNGYRAKSLRHIPGFAQHDQHKTAMWTTAARFRFVTIEISEPVLRYGNPPMYTNHLLGITILLCNTKNPPSLRDAVSLQPRTIQVHIGSLFHQMLPFNMESQAEARYGELLDWLFVHSPCAEPDFDKIAAESGHNLQRMVRIVSRHSERSQWKVLVDMQLDEKDDGGCKALQAFQTGCAQNGLSLEHLHQPLG